MSATGGLEGFETIPLPGAELLLCRQPELGIARQVLFDELLGQTPWQQREITLFGKTHLQPRLLAWYGDAEAQYRYSGGDYQPLPWTPTLAALRDRIGVLTGAVCNSVLVNLYRDGADSMGAHADDEPELGPQPVIASLSLGAERVLFFQHRHDRRQEGLKLPLADGALLLMRGDTQRNWKHGIRKTARAVGPRINLTFRLITKKAARR